MTLTALVSYFRNDGSYEEFCLSQALDRQSEVIEVYMEQPFGTDNDVAFFEIEKTAGLIEYTTNGRIYFNLFDFYYLLDVIEDAKDNVMTDGELAAMLLAYAGNDA